jgi:drug/metabolite transporter (DMT)-like permease
MWLGKLAALATGLCFAFGSVLFTLAGRKLGSALVNRIRLLLIVMGIHVISTGQLLPLGAGAERWFWLALSGFVGFVIGDAFLFQAFVLVGPRLAMLMMSLHPLIGAVLAGILFGEQLHLTELLGMALILGGVAWVVGTVQGKPKIPAETTSENPRRAYLIGLLCGLGGAAGQAGGIILSRLGMDGDFALVQGWPKLRAHPGSMAQMSAATLLGPVIGVSLSLLAIQLAPVGIASALMSMTPIFLIPISYVVFKDPITKHSILGTLLASAGTLLLFVGQ